MKLIEKGEYEKGIELLRPYWPLPESEIKQMIYAVQSQMSQIGSRFGDPIGYELIAAEKAGTSLNRILYIQKFKNHALRWMFVFYKPENTWQVNAVVYDDQLHNLF